MQLKDHIKTSKLKYLAFKDKHLDADTSIYALDDIANRLYGKAFAANKKGLITAISALIIGFAGNVHGEFPPIPPTPPTPPIPPSYPKFYKRRYR